MDKNGGALLLFVVAAVSPGCCATCRAWTLAHAQPVKLERAWLDEIDKAHAVIRWSDGIAYESSEAGGTRPWSGEAPPTDRQVDATLTRDGIGDPTFRTEKFVVSLERGPRRSLDCDAPPSPSGTVAAALLTAPAFALDVVLSPIVVAGYMTTACGAHHTSFLLCSGIGKEEISRVSKDAR